MAFDIEGARKSGYSDQEIADYLSQSNKFDAQSARQSGYSDSEIISHLSNQRQPMQAATESNQLPWSSVPGEAISNIPSSAKTFATGLWQTISDPVESAKNILDLGAGTLRNIAPESLRSVMDVGTPGAAERASNVASQVGGYYKKRYGSEEGVKKAIATDPVGVAGDLSALLYGGAKLADVARVPKISNALTSASMAVNPLNVAYQGVKGAGKAVSSLGKNVLGLTTGVGPESVSQAARSGFLGEKSFWENLTGKVPKTQVLEDAKIGLRNIAQTRANDYRNNMAAVSNDKSILDFNTIDKSISDAANISSFRGQITNQKAAEAVGKIANAVDEWKRLPPAQFHTPEGFDALKRSISGIVEGIPFEERTARLAAGKVYSAIKSSIDKQAPVYSKTMKDYSTASDLISEIERALSLKETASADTAMRKLQSLMRNNVQTNYGNRLDLAKSLEAQGGVDIMPQLAGQAMNSLASRGVTGRLENIGTLGYSLQNPAFLATLPIQSPKLVGGALYGGGRAAGLLSNAAGNVLNKMGTNPQDAMIYGLLSEQAGRDRFNY